MCFAYIWEQTAIISLYSINSVMLIMMHGCLYWGWILVFIYNLKVVHSVVLPYRINPELPNSKLHCMLLIQAAQTYQILTCYSLPVTWCTTSLTFNNCTLCPHCIYVFCIYLRTNSDLCHLQHKLIGFYNREEKCLQRGTDWVFKLSSLLFVFKWLMILHLSKYNFNNTRLLSSAAKPVFSFFSILFLPPLSLSSFRSLSSCSASCLPASYDKCHGVSLFHSVVQILQS